MNVHDCNQWRRSYDTASFEDSVVIHDRLCKEHPDQKHFSEKDATKFFERFEAREVLEIGGWDGELAETILSQNDNITSWCNYELASIPKRCSDSRYSQPTMRCFPWEMDLSGYDTLVASHVLEHMKLYQVDELISRAKDVGSCYVDLPEGDWNDKTCLHVLDEGVEDIRRALEQHRFNMVHTSHNEPEDSIIMWFLR